MFAKKPISKNTQFGPFIAEIVPDRTLLPKQNVLFQVSVYILRSLVRCTRRNLRLFIDHFYPYRSHGSESDPGTPESHDIHTYIIHLYIIVVEMCTVKPLFTELEKKIRYYGGSLEQNEF